MAAKGKKKSGGFTLVELAVVLIVFGLLVMFTTGIFVMNSSQREAQRTTESLDLSQVAITEFLARRGRYPCPADPTLAPADANYGREVCAPPWGGVTLATDGRDADSDGTPDEVLIGSVPYLTMIDPDGDVTTNDGIRNDDFAATHALDGWSNKLGYAVSRKLTVDTTYRDEWGAIRVRDENDLPVINPPGSAHFALLSYGANGRGARNKEGASVDGCGLSYTPPAGPPFPVTTNVNETENCDGDAGFMSGLLNKADHSYNDDFVRFQSNRRTQLWGYIGGYFDPTWTGAPEDAPVILQAANMNPGFVGIQTNNPQQQLDVNGRLRNMSNMRTVKLCDGMGGNCMEPALLGGDRPAMTCPDGEFVTGIELNQVRCAPPAAGATPLNTTCPPGEFITGITNLGGVVCDTPYIPP